MDEKVEEPQEQPSYRATIRQVSPEELKKILEAHRKWVDSEGMEGERADLSGANLQKAYLGGGQPPGGRPEGGQPVQGQSPEG